MFEHKVEVTLDAVGLRHALAGLGAVGWHVVGMTTVSGAIVVLLERVVEPPPYAFRAPGTAPTTAVV